MPAYKLTYFDVDGGRGEPIRIAFHAAGIAFEDNRLSFADFGNQRVNFRFNAVPVLEIDGAAFTQSNAISRYVGKQAGLYPADDLQAMYCDEVLGALEDLSHYVVQTFGLEGEALKQARKTLVEGRLTVFLKGFDQLLTRGGGQYFAGNTLSIADIKMFVQTRGLCSGRLDHIPTDLVDNVAPTLIAHQQEIAADPRIQAYYDSRA
ncbi:MAG: glutathione S-transferase [Granulosicoccus sp.]|nr:glutathione S-transferase [Granulosicoccus sp.]